MEPAEGYQPNCFGRPAAFFWKCVSGLPQPSNGTTNGNSPPVTPVPKKAQHDSALRQIMSRFKMSQAQGGTHVQAPPAALQAASKASLQKSGIYSA